MGMPPFLLLKRMVFWDLISNHQLSISNPAEPGWVIRGFAQDCAFASGSGLRLRLRTMPVSP